MPSRAPKRGSISPPLYRVEEDEHGNLVNKELKVIYIGFRRISAENGLYFQVVFPNFPKKGQYSLKNYLKKRQISEMREKNPDVLDIRFENVRFLNFFFAFYSFIIDV